MKSRLLLFLIPCLLLAACTSQSSPSTTPRPTASPVTQASPNLSGQISLNTFDTPTIAQTQPPASSSPIRPTSTPRPQQPVSTPLPACSPFYQDVGGGNCCESHTGYLPDGGSGTLTCCYSQANPGSMPNCVDKPVIYLYPPVPTKVTVTVETPGEIVASIPHYPQDGWQNVLAHPDGMLVYQDQWYDQLFYEISVPKIPPPVNGLVVSRDHLGAMLTLITSQLGLNHKEQADFLAYWVPRLTQLEKPYILVSLFPQTTKDTIEQVTITPQPDVFLAYLFYFKPLDTSMSFPPLLLPQVVPQRSGFTAVEWGGSVDMGQDERSI